MSKISLLAALLLLAATPARAAVTLGSNAVSNGGAESGTSGWSAVSPNPLFSTQAYGASGGWPLPTDPGPPSRGAGFFYGGNNATAEGHQLLDLSPIASTIASGATFAASAYLGGWSNTNDNATVTIRFQNSAGQTLSTVTMPGPSAAGRNNVTGLFLVSSSGVVPAAATRADVDLKMVRTAGTANDGYADALSLVFSASSAGGGSLDTNLVVNGDAEAGTTGWTPSGAAIAAQTWGASGGWPTASDPGPASRGTRFFYGGNNASADSFQSIDVSGLATDIAAGLRFTLGGFLGGYLTQDDRAAVVLDFLAADGSVLDTVTLGGPYAAERLNVTGLFYSQIDGDVPAGTRSLDLHVVVTRAGGTASDGYLDNLSVVLHH